MVAVIAQIRWLRYSPAGTGQRAILPATDSWNVPSGESGFPGCGQRRHFPQVWLADGRRKCPGTVGVDHS
jgi:hypothetical protein